MKFQKEIEIISSSFFFFTYLFISNIDNQPVYFVDVLKFEIINLGLIKSLK